MRSEIHALTPQTQQANPILARPSLMISHLGRFARHPVVQDITLPRDYIYAAQGSQWRARGEWRSDGGRGKGVASWFFYSEWLFHTHPWERNHCLLASLVEQSPFTAPFKML